MIERIYFLLSGDRSLPHAPELDPHTRRAIPANFLRYLGSHVLTKLGDALVNPKTTLTWLLGALAAPGWPIGLLVPVREALSMLLQFAVAGWVHAASRRKWVWVLGSLLQAIAVLGMAAAVLVLAPGPAACAVVALLALFALARSLSSIASKDVLGRILPKRRRGRATGWAASGAGAITLVAGGVALWTSPDELGVAVLAAILAGAAGLWGLAAMWFATIEEPLDRSHESGQPAPGRPLQRLGLIGRDPLLRRFILSRALMLCSALSAPYYLMIAQRGGGGTALLLAFIIAASAAGLLGGPVWGRFADRSSRLAMVAAVTGSAVLGLTVAAASQSGAAWTHSPMAMAAAFFLLSLAHEGVRTGRKTYIVNIASGEHRTDYVAVSNSAMGLALLLVGAGAAALADRSLELALAVLAAAGLAGALLGRELPEAEKIE